VDIVEILLKADEVEGKKWKDQEVLLEASKEGDITTVRRCWRVAIWIPTVLMRYTCFVLLIVREMKWYYG
jgi:hypothetical protein